ncbi:MAG: hypothetical protein ACON4U_20160 [Myxococcota bacterium]
MAQPPLQPRSKAASMFMAAPIVFASILMLAIAVLALLAWKGGAATGDRVLLKFSADCMADANPIIMARVEELGLGDPVPTISGRSLELAVTLPGLENDRQDIPRLLSQQGMLRVMDEDKQLATQEDIKSVSLDLDESGLPIVKVVFDPTVHQKLAQHIDASPRDSLSIIIDNSDSIERPNSAKLGEELRLVAQVNGTRAQMKVSADRTIVLNHGPIPCQVVVDSLEILEP